MAGQDGGASGPCHSGRDPDLCSRKGSPGWTARTRGADNRSSMRLPLLIAALTFATAAPAAADYHAGTETTTSGTLSATSPLLLGAVRDVAGGFEAVLWVLVAAGALLVLVEWSFSPARLRAARSFA